MARQPGADFRMLVRGIVIDHGCDFLFRWDLAVDCVEEADELFMAVAARRLAWPQCFVNPTNASVH
jgi:hypothetical protein